jgi:hypothetical protein
MGKVNHGRLLAEIRSELVFVKVECSVLSQVEVKLGGTADRGLFFFVQIHNQHI